MAWLVMKTPLDLDSVRPVVLPDEPPEDEHGFPMEAWNFKQPIGTFIHPKRGDKWPITMSSPSYSHDFSIEIGHPEGVEPIHDHQIGNRAAYARVHYADEDSENAKPREFRRQYPPISEEVSVSPHVASHLRRLGMGTAMYDLVDALGYKVIQSDTLSDEGMGLWEFNQPFSMMIDRMNPRPIPDFHRGTKPRTSFAPIEGVEHRVLGGLRWRGQEERNAKAALRRGDELEHG